MTRVRRRCIASEGLSAIMCRSVPAACNEMFYNEIPLCVCVCVRERERERKGGGKGSGGERLG
jgi:hypothetical protein